MKLPSPYIAIDNKVINTKTNRVLKPNKNGSYELKGKRYQHRDIFNIPKITNKIIYGTHLICISCQESKELEFFPKNGNIYRKKCKVCYSFNKRAKFKEVVNNLDTWYINESLRRQNLPITPELQEIKKLIIITYRLCQKSKN